MSNPLNTKYFTRFSGDKFPTPLHYSEQRRHSMSVGIAEGFFNMIGNKYKKIERVMHHFKHFLIKLVLPLAAHSFIIEK